MSRPPDTDPDGPRAVQVDLGDLGFDRGAHLLVDRAAQRAPAGTRVTVVGRDPALGVHLAVWARRRGHRLAEPGVVVTGAVDHARWSDAMRAGDPETVTAGKAPARWGLAARGALVESGGPEPRFDLDARDVVWADLAPRLYAQAAAAQWDPAAAVDWGAPAAHPPEVEDAVVQVMTYLVENEQAALAVPARFLARVHPHFREVVQLMAVQVADEARHVEVFHRRARLHDRPLGVSGAGGRTSLQHLLDEPDLTLALFLLSVLGEGSFLHLLSFLEAHAPDVVTRSIARLVLQDEARHVAFGQAHLELCVSADPALRGRLRVRSSGATTRSVTPPA